MENHTDFYEPPSRSPARIIRYTVITIGIWIILAKLIYLALR